MTLETLQSTTPDVHIHTKRLDSPARPRVLDAAWLRQLCFDAGADDVADKTKNSFATEIGAWRAFLGSG